MKFVHIADMHFDSTFTNLNTKNGLGNKRRLEQREVFKKVIDYIYENKIPYLFIAGDLYEQKYIRKTTIEYINELFKKIPNTKIFISPGNHDPYLRNSYYANFNWNENVFIFKANIEKIEMPDCNIYGYGFEDFYTRSSGVENIVLENKEKLNILLVHGSLDASQAIQDPYNIISSRQLEKVGFDYVALGHIHKNNIADNQNVIYPGSLISLGFDELGDHGMVVGNLEKGKLELSFIPLDHTKFIEKEINISEINLSLIHI